MERVIVGDIMKYTIMLLLLIVAVFAVACGQPEAQPENEYIKLATTEEPVVPETAGVQVVDENCTLNTADYCQWTNNGDGTVKFVCDNIPQNYAFNRIGPAYWQEYATCSDEYKTTANMAKVSAYEIERWMKGVTYDVELKKNKEAANVAPAPAWQ